MPEGEGPNDVLKSRRLGAGGRDEAFAEPHGSYSY
jgi:hypothetical protein